jgi:ATP-dependent Lon protease
MNSNKKDNQGLLEPGPGELIPWDKKKKEYLEITGNEKILEKTWKEIEKIGNRFIWFCLTDS